MELLRILIRWYDSFYNDDIKKLKETIILHEDKIDWWCQTYENKLKLYFENEYLVKDDQIILIDCVLSNDTKNEFNLISCLETCPTELLFIKDLISSVYEPKIYSKPF